jgi:hypothetical protein
MSNVDESSGSAAGGPPVKAGDLEVVLLPVSDADRTKDFRERAGEELPR